MNLGKRTGDKNTFCAYYNRGECRSCDAIELDYSAQLARKAAKLREALAFLGPFTPEPATPSMLEGFRNRAKLVVTGSSAAPVLGLAGERDLDSGRELLACPIHHPRLNAVIAALPAFISEFDLIPYRIVERKGELKGLILFYSGETGEMYLRFVLRSKECIARIRKGLPKLVATFPELTVVTANLQPIPHAILEGPEEVFLTERRAIRHAVDGIPFRLSPAAFVQTNSEVAAKLYATAADWIAETGAKRVTELYCGQGAFSFFAAQKRGIESVLGVDVNAEGVAAANESARAQGLTGLAFRAADAANVAKEVAAFAPDLLLVNPPRRGLGRAREKIRGLAPKTLLYSSCEVTTLAEDLRVFAPEYRLERARIFDLFPHTGHFETLVRLSR